MRNGNKISVVVEIEYKISLWEAIKLRIAGSGYEVVAKEIMKRLEERGNKS